MAGIYFHIPFCRRICTYCDFPRSADLRPMRPLLAAMHRELDARADALRGATVRTLYFGGGTPSLCAPGELQELVTHARRLFGFGRAEEITVECNPDDLTGEYVARLRDTEIDRVSVGVQSFDDACLRMMNRRHTAAAAVEAVRRLRRAGFANLTVDLIYGVPGFGGESLRRSLGMALSLEAEHLSAYHLTIEPGTVLGRRMAEGRFAPVAEETSEREFACVHDTLTAAGYEHYEVSNFARPGYRARHNSAYWLGAPYLGVGPSAHSYDGSRRRSWNVASNPLYLSGTPPEEELLTDTDLQNEYLMTRLRRAEGISTADFCSRFGETETRRLETRCAVFEAAGDLFRTPAGWAIPPARWLISDYVISRLFR